MIQIFTQKIISYIVHLFWINNYYTCHEWWAFSQHQLATSTMQLIGNLHYAVLATV